MQFREVNVIERKQASPFSPNDADVHSTPITENVVALQEAGFTSFEIEEGLRRTKGPAFIEERPEFKAWGQPENTVRDSRVEMVMSNLDSLIFRKKKGLKGVGFKVGMDSSGRNAIVTKVINPELRENGLIPGAIVTQIEEITVVNKDFFDILNIYRKIEAQETVSIVFAVPGLKRHFANPAKIRKRGHKYTLMLVLTALFLTLAAIGANVLEKTSFTVDNVNYEFSFTWSRLYVSIPETKESISRSYQDIPGVSTTKTSGILFFSFQLASLCLYLFLSVVALMLGCRRPRKLIRDFGDLLRTCFLLLCMSATITSLTSWSSWIAMFNVPTNIEIAPNRTVIIPADAKSTLADSLYLSIVATCLTIMSVFTAIIQL